MYVSYINDNSKKAYSILIDNLTFLEDFFLYANIYNFNNLHVPIEKTTAPFNQKVTGRLFGVYEFAAREMSCLYFINKPLLHCCQLCMFYTKLSVISFFFFH